MWWLWPHLRRLWTVTGAVLVGLIVTWLYSLLSEQAVPHPSIVATLFHDHWPWFGGAAVALHDEGAVIMDEWHPLWAASHVPSSLHHETPMVMGQEEIAQV
jgi:hypothetical protein